MSILTGSHFGRKISFKASAVFLGNIQIWLSLVLIAPQLSMRAARSQQLYLNEVMPSNTATLADEEGHYPDWIELINLEAEAISLRGYGLSTQREKPFQWTFSDRILESREYMLVFASGKSQAASRYWETVIDRGDVWRYRPGSSEPEEAWKTRAYDDSGWRSGKSGFGYGDGDDATVVSPTVSLYVRKVFRVEDPHNITALFLHVDYDDAFVAYLNGVEIARANIGISGEFTAYHRTADDHREAQLYRGGRPESYAIENFQTLLKSGENVLAIQVHNYSLSSTDLSLIPFLTIGYRSAPSHALRGVPELLQPLLPRNHTSFELSAGGETLYLHNPEGELLDSLRFGPMQTDISIGRQPDGSGRWYVFAAPTPGAANATTAYQAFSPAPTISLPAGHYAGPVNVSLSVEPKEALIYYTLDGSEPDQTSQTYHEPLTIDTTSVLRTRTLLESYLPSRSVTRTYLIGESTTLPVVSLATDPKNLWDEKTGIYVKGPGAGRSFPYFNANFWQDWERPVHVEFFETNGELVFSQYAGVKIYGAWSRAYPQKSFALLARGRYGAKTFEHKIFPDRPIVEFRSIVLRNSGNDWTSTMLRDGMMQSLVAELDLDTQAYRPATVFLNGVYWGIYNIREKMNEDYLAAHYDIDPERVDLLENNGEVLEGDNAHYFAVIRYIESHNLADSAHYAQVSAWIDIPSFIDYTITEIFVNNTDWPGNNFKFWRPQKPGGKWRWLLFDLDFGFGLYDSEAYADNTLAFATEANGPAWPNPPWSTFLLRNLLKNEKFRHAFINRFADHLNSTFKTSYILQAIQQAKTRIAPEMPAHRRRWPEAAMNWTQNIQTLQNFATFRPAHATAMLMQYFGLKGQTRVTIDVAPKEGGRVKVNRISPVEYPWSGNYFTDVPLPITALANPGYRFAGWSDTAFSETAATVYEPVRDLNVTARFEKTAAENGSVVINEINYNSSSQFDPGDWIELYNATGSTIDLSGWRFLDELDTHVFVLPDNTHLDGGAYLVLCQESSQFAAAFPELKNVHGSFHFGLSGGGELLRLENAGGNLVDFVRYDDEAPWPTEPDGSGFTLELIDAQKDNAVAANWRASTIFGGTPGRANSTTTHVSQAPSVPAQFYLYPNYPNPFNAGTIIQYAIPEAAEVRLEIFNVLGQLLARIEKVHAAPGTYSIRWRPGEAGTAGGTRLGLPSGILYYGLEARGKAMTHVSRRKMVYLK